MRLGDAFVGGAVSNTMTRARDHMPDRHIPVLLDQVVEMLCPGPDQIIVDGTFGAGGYTRAILEAAPCSVIAIDRDPAATLFSRPSVDLELKSRVFLCLQGLNDGLLSL